MGSALPPKSIAAVSHRAAESLPMARRAGQGHDPRIAEPQGRGPPPLRVHGGARDPLDGRARKDAVLAGTHSLRHRPVGQHRPRHLSPRAIGLVVGRRRHAAHLGPLSTHDWRRTFVGDLLDSGARLLAAPVAVSPSAKHPPSSRGRRRRTGRAAQAGRDPVESQVSWPLPAVVSALLASWARSLADPRRLSQLISWRRPGVVVSS
jgi:hypothetical protein